MKKNITECVKRLTFVRGLWEEPYFHKQKVDEINDTENQYEPQYYFMKLGFSKMVEEKVA